MADEASALQHDRYDRAEPLVRARVPEISELPIPVARKYALHP